MTDPKTLTIEGEVVFDTERLEIANSEAQYGLLPVFFKKQKCYRVIVIEMPEEGKE